MKRYGFAIPFFTKKTELCRDVGNGKPKSDEIKNCDRWSKRLARRLGKFFIKEQVEEPSKSHTG